MTLINAKLKCGCFGSERLDHDSVGIRFLVQAPCARHRVHQWLHLGETDLEWRDLKQWKYWTRALELREQWFVANAEALAKGETPKPNVIEFQVERLRAEGFEEDDDLDELDE